MLPFGDSSVYTIHPCISLQCPLIQSDIGKVCVCLAVTCHLHFWQNDRDLLRQYYRLVVVSEDRRSGEFLAFIRPMVHQLITTMMFPALVVAVKWEVFTTSRAIERQLGARPATQRTRSPLLPANHIRRSIAHAQNIT